MKHYRKLYMVHEGSTVSGRDVFALYWREEFPGVGDSGPLERFGTRSEAEAARRAAQALYDAQSSVWHDIARAHARLKTDDSRELDRIARVMYESSAGLNGRRQSNEGRLAYLVFAARVARHAALSLASQNDAAN